MSPNTVMVCHHDARLVVLSILISLMAAFAARALHEEIGQALTAAKINVQSAIGSASAAASAHLPSTLRDEDASRDFAQ